MRRTPIERRSGVAPLEFVASYLIPNRPVVIEDAVSRWPASARWNAAYFRDRFGDLTVSLQGRWVEEVATVRLGDYLDALTTNDTAPASAFGPDRVVPYLRSTHARGDDFSGRVLATLHADWARPYFLPAHGYLRPLVLRSDPTRRRHPHFGVYISPRGAVTRLHVDGSETDAILCQFRGTKRFYLIAPDQRHRLPAAGDRAAPCLASADAPDFGDAEVLEAVVGPGDCIFMPRSWAHEVYTLEASVSLTYNFLHFSNSLGWPGWRRVPGEVVRRARAALLGDRGD